VYGLPHGLLSDERSVPPPGPHSGKAMKPPPDIGTAPVVCAEALYILSMRRGGRRNPAASGHRIGADYGDFDASQGTCGSHRGA